MEKIWPEKIKMEYEEGNLEKNSLLRLYYNDHLTLDTGVKGVLERSYNKISVRTKTLLNMCPVLVNDRGQIVCIPKSNDEPTIGIIGQRRQGKTLMNISILDSSYHNCNNMCGIVADQTGESNTWGKGNDSKIFLNKMKILNQQPMGLPIVQLFPHIEGGIMPKPRYSPIIPISYAFDDFIKYPEKLQELKGSAIYFDAFKEDIEQFKIENGTITLQDILDLVEQRTVRKKNKNENVMEKGGLPPGTSNKIKSIFIGLWKKKIFDSTCNYPSYLTLKTNKGKYKLDPFSACMAAKLIPALLTSQLQQETHYENYFQNFLEKIYYQQTKPGNIFYDNQLRIWLFCDELNNIPKLEIIRQIFRTGGPNRIGVVWSAQEPARLDETIIKQTKYFIIFKPNTEDIKVIEKNYGLTKAQMTRIRNQEKYQCCLVSQEPVYIYDPKMNTLRKDTITENPQFGGMIFPISQPKAPAEEERFAEL